MLQTERLTIQELKPENWIRLKTIVTEFGESEYAVYDMQLPTEDDKIKSLCEQFAASKLWFAVWLSNEMIGYICFHQNGTTYDLGYCFLPEYQGYGYAYESYNELLRYMENTRSVTDIYHYKYKTVLFFFFWFRYNLSIPVCLICNADFGQTVTQCRQRIQFLFIFPFSTAPTEQL